MCRFKYKFDGRKGNVDQEKKKKFCQREFENPIKHVYEKYYIWYRSTCTCESNRYLKSIIGDSVITCDEIIVAAAKSYDNTSETVKINFNEKR